MTKHNSVFKFFSHLALATALATAVFLLSWLLFEILPSLGYGLLLVVYILILVAFIYFYKMTGYFSPKQSLLHFALNFILWCTEQVIISSAFEKSIMYQDENYKILIVVLGAVLWASNKLILDKIFTIWVSNPKRKNKLDSLWIKSLE